MKNELVNIKMERAHHSDSENNSDEEEFLSETKIEEKAIHASNPLNQDVNTRFRSVRNDEVFCRIIYKNCVLHQWKALTIIITILVAFSGYFLSSSYKRSGNAFLVRERENELLKYLNFLKMEYGHQDQKLWNVVGSQIAEYLNHSTAPLTIVMVYKEADKTAKLLASEVSRKAVELKHNFDVCGDLDSLKIEGTGSVIDGGDLLEEKLSSVTRCKKLLVFNVENLRPSAAADLHSLLDPDYPNVESAVYIFTVKITAESDRSIYSTVSNLLKKNWGVGLHSDILEPLLSRLVNFVMVKPEPQLETNKMV